LRDVAEIGHNHVVKNVVTSPELALSPAERRTRDRVARLLLEQGPSTAAALATKLGLTPAGVRRHLDALVEEGVVTEVPERPIRGRVRGRGRPAKLFAVSESGREAFPHAYDDIATAALRFLADTGGEQAVMAFAEARVAELEDRYRDELAATAAEERPYVLAEALTADGYAASTEAAGCGVQLCQHHCPVQHVAEAFPQLCEAETAAFGRLLGSHVQRLATLAHGDGVCTTHIPLSVPASRTGRTA
jgi:predicted ArsR family transcriptional regulator